MKRSFIIAGLLAVLLVAFAGCGDNVLYTPLSEPEFSTFGCETPEDAMQQFVERLSATQTNGAIMYFSFEHKAENFNFAEYTDRVQAFIPMNGGMPEYDMYGPVNYAYFLNHSAMQMRMFMLSFLMDAEQLNNVQKLDDLDMDSAALMQSLDPAPLKNLKLLRTDLANSELQESESYRKNTAALKKCFGYDDSKEYTALYELDGEYYMGGFTLVQYDKKWYIDSLTSILANMSATGAAGRITEQEYLDIVGE